TSARRTVTGTPRRTVTSTTVSALPGLGNRICILFRQIPRAGFALGACSQVQVVVPCWSVLLRAGQTNLSPGGAGRSAGSNAPPGVTLATRRRATIGRAHRDAPDAVDCQLILAFQTWTRDEARSLADPLVARGGLDADACAGLEPPLSHPSS